MEELSIIIGVLIVIGGLIAVIASFTSGSGVEKIDKSEKEIMARNEMRYNHVINKEPNERARGIIQSAKKMFDSGEAVDFLDVYIRAGVPEEVAYSKDAELISSFVGFESERAKDLFNTYCFALTDRFELQNRKLEKIEDAFEKHKIVLNKGEILYKSFNGIYCFQEKTIRKNVSYSGMRYGYGPFRAGNLSYSIQDIKTLQVEDLGMLLLTSKRVIFTGKRKNFSLSMTIGNILDYYLYKDAVLLCRNNMKNVLFRESQIDNHSHPNDEGFTFLNDFPIQFISIIGRIANQTENQDI